MQNEASDVARHVVEAQLRDRNIVLTSTVLDCFGRCNVDTRIDANSVGKGRMEDCSGKGYVAVVFDDFPNCGNVIDAENTTTTVV